MDEGDLLTSGHVGHFLLFTCVEFLQSFDYNFMDVGLPAFPCFLCFAEIFLKTHMIGEDILRNVLDQSLEILNESFIQLLML
jgi:hypothetical protein